VLILAFVSLVFQKSTESENWAHRLKIEDFASIIGIPIFSVKI